jgi:hypothetical protein
MRLVIPVAVLSVLLLSPARTGMMAIRKGDWKLVKTQEGPIPDLSQLDDLSSAGLYDLARDIGESNDLTASNPAKAKELAEEWQRWNRQLAKPLWPSGRGRGLVH